MRVKLAFRDVAQGEFFGGAEADVVLSGHRDRLMQLALREQAARVHRAAI